MKKGSKLKSKFQETKFYKNFRRLTSLGLAGILTLVFPNEIIAWTSAGVGALYGKGIIGFKLMASIVTFLGSAGGLFLQKIVFAGLTFLFSNIILKRGKQLGGYLFRKIGLSKNKTNSAPAPQKKVEAPVKKIETPVKAKEVEKVVKEVPKEPINEPKKPDPVKKLGVHPSMKK